MVTTKQTKGDGIDKLQNRQDRIKNQPKFTEKTKLTLQECTTNVMLTKLAQNGHIANNITMIYMYK